MQSRELVKLYYRIGEVSEIVGVQPHVLRYWETEFRSIRPQKSSKGQRVYSRRDVEKLLRVKDLLRNQGFTIAGARKRLSEPMDPAPSSPGAPTASPAGVSPVAVPPAAVPPVAVPPAAVPPAAMSPASVSPVSPLTPVASASAGNVVSLVESAAAAKAALAAAPAAATGEAALDRAADRRAKDMRKALVGLRQDLLQMLGELEAMRARQPSGH